MKYIILYHIDDYLEEGGGDDYEILDSLHKVKAFIKYRTKCGEALEAAFKVYHVYELGNEIGEIK